MRYSDEHKQKAKAEDVPLVKIEIDFRHAKDKTKRFRRQCWGAATPEIAKKLSDIIIHDMN